MAKATAGDRIDPKVMKVAVALIVGSLAVVFDTTIVSVALQTLSQELHVPISTIQWVSTGYLLALGVSIPLAGWAQSRFGGRRVWMFALAVFLVDRAFWWAAGFTALSLLLSLLLPGRTSTGTPKKPEPETAKPPQTV